MIAALEREILGQLILRPQLLEVSDVTDADFSAGDERKAFHGIAGQWEELRPTQIDIALLARETGLSEDWLVSLASGNIRPEPQLLAARLYELRKLRLGEGLQRLAHDTGEAIVKTGAVDTDRLYAELERARAFLSSDGNANGADSLARCLMTGAELQALDLKVDYVMDKLAPCRSLILIHGPGGLAKTWLALCIARAVSEGRLFLGLNTKQGPATYVDYENPLPMLVDRVRKLDIREVRFWHLSANPRPPKLDSDDWAALKALPPGLVIFDTARSSFDGDENSSQDVGLVMGRLKELRELGNTVIVLHHTPRANERASKGSTAWEDLADHVLSFYKAKRTTLEATDEEVDIDPSALLSLGTGRKTRYEHFRLYMTLDPEGDGFRLAQDPKTAKMDQLAAHIAGEGAGQNQTKILAWIKDELGIRNTDAAVALLKRGDGSRWRSSRGFQNARIYEPL